MKDKNWNPYLAGGVSGVLAVLSVWLTGKFLGASTTFVRAAGMIERLFNSERVAQMDYFVKTTPKIDWQFMFVAGIFIGALIGSLASRSFKWQAVPDMWSERFGSRRIPRAITAFVGAVIAIFGARLAGGCPSGHGLSGMMQLSISGYISLVCFFAGGVVMARLLYGGGKRQ